MASGYFEAIGSWIVTHIYELKLFFVAYFSYLTVLFIIRWAHLSYYMNIPLNELWKGIVGNLGRVYSPDYYTASIFKSLSGYGSRKFLANYYQTIYVKIWNKVNIYASIFCYIIMLMAINNTYVFSILFWLSYVRFFSRCSEISIAFFHDVIRKPERSIQKRNTFLTKYERVQLAVTSYFEIYFLSAAIYLTNKPFTGSWLSSVFDTLSVGSLTNVGILVTAPPTGNEVYAFVQVFTTLVLVLMSLAVYLGREK